MSTSDNTDEILRDWGALWVASNGGQKDHLTDACPYVNERYRRLTPEQKPAAHVDLCSWCRRYYDRWLDGTDGPGGGCDRCGGETDTPPRGYAGHELCGECYRQVRLRR